MPDLQRYPLKRWLIKYEINIHAVISFNCLFHLQVLCKSDFRISCLLKAIEKMFRIKQISSQKNGGCKLGIAIFERVN